MKLEDSRIVLTGAASGIEQDSRCVLPITATQPNLPPGWTGGNRMAIHGTTSALGLANSNGCVRNGESDMRFLMAKAPLGTPVTIKG